LHFRSQKLDDIATAWAVAVEWAYRHKVDIIVQTGDVFNHTNVYGREASTGTIFSKFLEPFLNREHQIPLFLIPGNHDIGLPRDKDALAPIEHYPWVKVVRRPSVINLNNGFSICAIPWVNRIHLISNLLSKGMKIDEASKRVNESLSKLMSTLAVDVKVHKDKGNFVLAMGHLDITGSLCNGMVQYPGAFEFSPLEIGSLGANAYAFGHIHLRHSIPNLPNPNDGYLGTLCQLNFGEEGRVVGCRYIEIDKTTIIKDEWIDNNSSPKYFTVNTLEGLSYRPGTDWVKLRSLTKPDNLPERVIFERLPQAVQNRMRTEEKLDSDLSLRTLLGAWKKVTDCKVDLDILVAEAEKQQSTAQAQTEAIGSLERLNKIRLKNITCHGNTEIDLNVNGICGLAGPNGSGKTTAIETIMLALYGISPSRPILKSLLPKGEKMESLAELEFISSGIKYIARREFLKNGKSFSHKAYVFKGDDTEPVASSVDGVHTYSSSLVGDPDLVLAGVFSSQGDAGNLVKQQPGYRKELFAKLLGTEKFLSLAESSKKLSGNDIALIQAQKARIETLKLELFSEDEDNKALVNITEKLIVAQENLKKEQQKLRTTCDNIQALEDIRKEVERLGLLVETYERRREKIREEGISLKQEKEKWIALASENIDKELEAIRKAKEEMDGILSSISEKQQQALEREKKLNTIKQERQNEHQIINNKLQSIKNKSDVLFSSLNEAKKRNETLKFPDLEPCQKCPLAEDRIANRNKIPGLEEELKVLNQKMTRGEEVIKQYAKDTELLLSEIEPVNGIEELNSKKNALAPSLSKLSELEIKAKKIASAQSEISKINALLEAARNNFKDMVDEIQKTKDSIPAFDNAKWKVMKTEKDRVESNIIVITNGINGANVQIGTAKAKIEQHQTRKNEMTKLWDDIKEKEEKALVYEALMKACGKDGIPQLVVDSAIPHLQEIMFDMMTEIDGRWSIRVATQKETLKGGVQERIDILVDDGEEERDISTYSGGEMNLLSTIVRIAFSILQAERSGKGLKVLVLDEAMYFADDAHADSFMKMLQGLPKYFNQIFVISHSEFILSSIQNKIFFQRPSDGKTVIQTEFDNYDINNKEVDK